MTVNKTDFDKIWASTSSVPEYTFSNTDYKNGWEFVGNLPPTRAMWDKLQKRNDEKMQYLMENGTNWVDNVATLRTTDANIGEVYGTKGYYSANDGGQGFYIIRADASDTDDGGSVIVLDNGNVAELVLANGQLNVKQFGVMPTDTTTDALSKINDILALNKFHSILIPADINYGYDRHYPATYTLDVYSCTIRVTIWDYSIDNSYVNDDPLNPDKGTNANQLRIWSNTPNSSDGLHDGNLFTIGGNRHPALFLSNDGVDENRASVAFGKNHTINWLVGQGTYDDNENFRIANTETTYFAISKENGNICIGGNYVQLPCAIERQVTIETANNTFLRYVNAISGTSVSNSFYADATKFAIRNNMLTSPEILSLTQNGRTLTIFNKTGSNAGTGFVLNDGNSKTAQITVDGTTLKFAHNGSEVMRTDDNNAIVCAKGVSGGSGTTVQRPSAISIGTMFFDTTLGKPIWYKGSSVWVDATGTTV